MTRPMASNQKSANAATDHAKIERSVSSIDQYLLATWTASAPPTMTQPSSVPKRGQRHEPVRRCAIPEAEEEVDAGRPIAAIGPMPQQHRGGHAEAHREDGRVDRPDADSAWVDASSIASGAIETRLRARATRSARET